MLKLLINIFVIFTILHIPVVTSGAPLQSFLRKEQKAPFAGYLLNEEAMALIITEKENTEKACQIDTELALKLQKAKCDLIENNLKVELEVEKSKNIQLLLIKDKEIDKLHDIIIATVKEEKSDTTMLWAIGGFITGVGLSVFVFYTAVQISKK